MRRALTAINNGERLAPLRTRTNPAYKSVRPPQPKLEPHAQFFKRAVAAAQLAHNAGEAISFNSIVARDSQLAVPELHELLDTELFKETMEERGITDRDYLTERQLAALAVLGDHTVRKPERSKLATLGIKYGEFQNWLSSPVFRREYRAMQNRTLNLATERGDTVLAGLIDDGNMRAIEYANAFTGRYDPANREAVNTIRILQLVQSLVQKHVTDEVTLMRLSEDFAQLAAQGGLAQLETLDAEVVEPPSD